MSGEVSGEYKYSIVRGGVVGVRVQQCQGRCRESTSTVVLGEVSGEYEYSSVRGGVGGVRVQ